VKLKLQIWLLLGALMGVVLTVDLTIGYNKLVYELNAENEYDARTIYGLMMATRRIYQQQFVDSGLPVNEATVGFLPAHSMSRIAKDFANWNDSGILFNNVSDQPRNPGNRADRFEMEAIDWFRANPKALERMREIVDDRGVGYLLYTAPIWVEPFCLKCHGNREDAPASIRDKYADAYGYQVGDLRGVASVKIPMAKFDQRLNSIWRDQVAKTLIGYAVLFLGLGLLLDKLVTRRLARLQASAESLAAGDYGVRMAQQGTDELCQLAGSFNHMAEAVQARDRELTRLSHYDALTGLPNRMLLEDRLELGLALSHRQAGRNALLLFNIDRFKNLNDARGHALGDALLVAVGGRLLGLLREGDTLARLGGDEFAVLMQGLSPHRETASNSALTVAEKIHADLKLPFILGEGEEVILTASLGITLCPDGDNDIAHEVLRRADTALHRAKDAGGNQTAFFDTGMGESAEQRFRIERELRKAIPAGELRLFLQPQVDANERLVGAEALVRWQHPQRGLLPPGVFIGIAEESDLIVDLGGWVLSEACQLMARETMAGRPLRISVNLSPRQFRQPSFVRWVKDLLAASGADPTHLTLEVTEGLVIDNIGEVVAKMSELTALGIHFSLDDFGTGYSSLAYLKRLPIDELKIDKTFIQDAPTDPDDAAVVETILSVARHMHLRVVAEGVETEAQAAYLHNLANITYQGYLYGKPEPAQVWIERWQAESATP
jgi:diguanylate cyclase (GGDEF)-like protein